MFSMIDAENKSGGTSQIQVVESSGDSSCLSSNSPSSTPSVPQSSPSASSLSQTGSSTPSKFSTATIIGVAAGGVVALAALVFLGLCLARRRRKKRPMYTLDTPRRAPLLGDLHPEPNISTPQNGILYRDRVQSSVPLDTTTSPTPLLSGTYDSPSASTSTPSPPNSSIMASSGGRKGPMTVLTPACYIMHTDAEDTGAEVIELPPQYSERQVPGSQPRPMSSISEYGPTDLAYASDAFQDQPSLSYPRRRPPP